MDAVVHETADPDDPGLLALLNAGQPQVDENAAGDGPGHSNQRCPNGSGGARNTDTYAPFSPTVGAQDAVDPRPACVADLNGVPVTDGQITQLVKAPGQPITMRLGPVLFMKDESFTLTVTGTDARGNSATATAEPVFGS